MTMRDQIAAIAERYTFENGGALKLADAILAALPMWQPIDQYAAMEDVECDLFVISKHVVLSGKVIAPMGLRLPDCIFSDGIWVYQPYPLDDYEPVLDHFERITHALEVPDP